MQESQSISFYVLPVFARHVHLFPPHPVGMPMYNNNKFRRWDERALSDIPWALRGRISMQTDVSNSNTCPRPRDACRCLAVCVCVSMKVSGTLLPWEIAVCARVCDSPLSAKGENFAGSHRQPGDLRPMTDNNRFVAVVVEHPCVRGGG